MNMSPLEDGTAQGTKEGGTKAGDLAKANVSLASPMSHLRPSAHVMCSWGWGGVGWGVITSFGSRHKDYILTLLDLLLYLHTYATL